MININNKNYDTHVSSTNNPHAVTKSQVGLGSVANVDTSTTANITDSLNKRFVSDAQKAVLSTTSGTNTGDETLESIKNKLGSASTTTDGYLTKEDFTSFAKTLNGVVSGTTINITDAQNNAYFNNIIVNGRTTQKTYDGVQIIPFTLASLKSGNTAGIWNGNNYTVSGVTFVVSTDSENNVTSITALGTASANVTLMLKTPSDGRTIATATSHTLTGCPTGGSGTTYYLRVQNYEDSAGTVWKSNQDDVGSGKIFSTNYLYFNCYIRINSGVTVSNKIFTPMLTTTAVRPHIYEPYVGNSPAPNINFPQPLVGIGNDLSLVLTVGIDNLNTDDTQITLTLPNPIYQSDFLGLYDKDICVLKNITYDKTKEGLWGIFQNSNKIISYNSETITGDYDSTTGGLDVGATVIYYENTEFTFIPLIASEQNKLNTLKQKGYSMYISNDDVANMEIYYNTKNSTIKTLSSKLSTHIEDTNSHGAYSIIKQTLAEDGYIATYQLTKNGTPLGSKINIPKDYLVKSGTLETCSQNNNPVNGYIIGDKYLDFIINTVENTGNTSHIYIKVTDLIDIYVEGNGIDITNNSISVVINSVSNGLFVNSGGVGLNVATTNSNGAFSSGEKTKLNNIKKSIIAETTANLLTANWVGSVAPYTVDILLSIPDYTVTSDNDINISPIYNSNQTIAQSEMEAYSYLSRGEIIADNTIRFTCYDYKPSVDLNINIEILKDFAQEELMNYIDSKVTEISSIDLNTLFDVGLYLGYGCTNTPIQTSLGYFSLQVHGKTNNIVQILVDTTTSYVYTRSYTGTWTTWEKLSSSVKGMSFYAATHGAGANYGSGTWISGDTNPTVDFKTKAKSTIVIGSDSLKNSTNMVDIIALGDGIIPTGKGGEHNIGIGLWALHSLNIGTASASEYGDRNIAIGSLSYQALVDGRANTGLGRDTAQCCVHGSFDIAIGYQSLAGQAPVNFKREIDHWWEGDYTHIIGVGYQAGQEIVSATADMFLGSFCGRQVKTGSYSNLFGYNCGVNLEYDKSYNGKKIVLVTESATYATNGTVNIVVTKVGHQAVIGNYVTLTFTSGVCNVLSSDIQLMYVNAVDGDTFTLTSPVIIENGSGNCTISRYEVEIPVGEVLGLLNSSNIMGTGSCYFTKRVNQSNVFGMRSSNRTECDNMDVMGYSTFYGLGTGVVGVAKESQVIGAFACYNVDDILASSVIGYQAGYNATTRILNSVINGWKSSYNAIAIENSIVLGEESLLNTTTIQNTVNVGGNTKHTYSSLNKCTFIGEMAGEGTDVGITALENSTCVGYNTAVTGNNQVQLGDVNTTTYVYGTVQNRSDMRDKTDIRDTELGLDFIKKLRPVDFKWNYRELYKDCENDGSKKGNRYHHGLITQEVFDIIKETGKDFGGYQDHSINGGSDVQSLGYDEFIAPLVKSIQELSEMVLILQNKVKELENK